MIKIINCKNNISKLINFLESRRIEKNNNLEIVHKIIKDIKKNKLKALLNYE